MSVFGFIVCVHVYVYEHVCIYVCMHVCIYECMYLCMHVCMQYVCIMYVCTYVCSMYVPIPVAARSKALVCSRLLAGTADSNPAGGMTLCVLRVLFIAS